MTCALARAITFSSTPSVLTAHSRCLRAVPRARLLHGARRTSLPLQSAAYASASTRALCAPQRAHNAVSLCQCALPCDRLAWKFGGRALPPQLQRVLALSPPRVGRLPSAMLRTTCALSARNRCSRSSPPFLPPLASQTKSRCVQRSCLPTAAALPVSKEMGLHRSRQSVVACNRRPSVETAASFDCGLPRQRDSRLFRAPGPPGDQADDRLKKRVDAGLTPQRQTRPVY